MTVEQKQVVLENLKKELNERGLTSSFHYAKGGKDGLVLKVDALEKLIQLLNGL